jgi:RecA-family ATPase
MSEQLLRKDFRRLYPCSDIARGLVLQPPFLFDNFLLSKTVSLISAEPGTGKTWLMLEMMLCLELGEKLLGSFAPAKGHHRCLMLMRDSSAWDVAKQFQKLCRGRGLSKQQVEGFNSDMLLRGDGRFTLTDKSRLSWLREWISATKTDVVFIDTLRAINVGDENNSLQMEALMEAMRSLRDDMGVAVITSHHTRKAQKDFDDSGNDAARGSSAITGALDFHIRLQRNKRNTILTMPKGREDFTGWESISYNRETIGTPPTQGVIFRVEQPMDTYSALLHAMRAGCTERGAIITKVQTTLGLPADKAAKFTDNGLRALRLEGIIRSGGRGSWELIGKEKP